MGDSGLEVVVVGVWVGRREELLRVEGLRREQDGSAYITENSGGERQEEHHQLHTRGEMGDERDWRSMSFALHVVEQAVSPSSCWSAKLAL